MSKQFIWRRYFFIFIFYRCSSYFRGLCNLFIVCYAKSWVLNDSVSWSSVICSWLDGDTDTEKPQNSMEWNLCLLFPRHFRVHVSLVFYQKAILYWQNWNANEKIFNANTVKVLLLSIAICGCKSLSECYKFLRV